MLKLAALVSRDDSLFDVDHNYFLERVEKAINVSSSEQIVTGFLAEGRTLDQVKSVFDDLLCVTTRDDGSRLVTIDNDKHLFRIISLLKSIAVKVGGAFVEKYVRHDSMNALFEWAKEYEEYYVMTGFSQVMLDFVMEAPRESLRLLKQPCLDLLVDLAEREGVEGSQEAIEAQNAQACLKQLRRRLLVARGGIRHFGTL